MSRASRSLQHDAQPGDETLALLVLQGGRPAPLRGAAPTMLTRSASRCQAACKARATMRTLSTSERAEPGRPSSHARHCQRATTAAARRRRQQRSSRATTAAERQGDASGSGAAGRRQQGDDSSGAAGRRQRQRSSRATTAAERQGDARWWWPSSGARRRCQCLVQDGRSRS